MTDFEKKIRIRDLKQMLDNSDFKVLKCYEAQMLGETTPYNVTELVAQRRAWRDELNVLEAG